MAGLGEACSHIAAVLFYIEAVVRKRDEQSCTDRENAWMPPHVRTLKCVPISEMDFSSSKMKKRVLDGEESQRMRASDADVAEATSEEWLSMLTTMFQ